MFTLYTLRYAVYRVLVGMRLQLPEIYGYLRCRISAVDVLR